MLGSAFLDYRIAKKKSDNGVAVEINGEGTLGLASSSAAPFLRCSFGFAEHYWWSVNLTGDRRSGHSLVKVRQQLFGFIPVIVGINTRTKLKLDSLQLGVGRTVFESGATKLGVEAGIHVVDYALSIQTPLPSYSMDNTGLGATAFGGIVASHKFHAANLSLELNYSSINYNDKTITFFDSGMYASYMLSRHIGGGLAYLHREIGIDSYRDNTSSNGIYRMSGPYLFVKTAW